MSPLPSLAPSLWGAASPFSAALNSMKAPDQQQQQQPRESSPAAIKSAVFASMQNGSSKGVVAASPAEGPAIKMYSPEYYMTCALGGVVSCGATHTAVTPLVGRTESGCSSCWSTGAAARVLRSCCHSDAP